MLKFPLSYGVAELRMCDQARITIIGMSYGNTIPNCSTPSLSPNHAPLMFWCFCGDVLHMDDEPEEDISADKRENVRQSCAGIRVPKFYVKI